MLWYWLIVIGVFIGWIVSCIAVAIEDLIKDKAKHETDMIDNYYNAKKEQKENEKDMLDLEGYTKMWKE